MEENEWDSEFQRIVSDFGRSERSAPSDSEEIINRIHILKETSQLRYLQALTAMQQAATIAILAGILLGTSWSIYAWFF